MAATGSSSRAKSRGNGAKLSDAELDNIAGKRELLIRRIRQLYGISQEQAEKQVSSWVKRVKPLAACA